MVPSILTGVSPGGLVKTLLGPSRVSDSTDLLGRGPGNLHFQQVPRWWWWWWCWSGNHTVQTTSINPSSLPKNEFHFGRNQSQPFVYPEQSPAIWTASGNFHFCEGFFSLPCKAHERPLLTHPLILLGMCQHIHVLFWRADNVRVKASPHTFTGRKRYFSEPRAGRWGDCRGAGCAHSQGWRAGPDLWNALVHFPARLLPPVSLHRTARCREQASCSPRSPRCSQQHKL